MPTKDKQTRPEDNKHNQQRRKRVRFTNINNKEQKKRNNELDP